MLHYYLIASAMLLCNFCFSQTLIRSSIGSFGNSVAQNGISIQQTMGQSTAPGTVTIVGTDLRQGFIQPPLGNANNKLSDNSQINLWPNPTQGAFTFSVSGPQSTFFSYSIYSVSGSLIRGGTGTFNTPVNITETNIAQGFYFLNISIGSNLVGVSKFIMTR